MARPRKDASGKTALQRLEYAFWDTLSQQPYSQMTIKAISARAGVNHNTFYYHYESLDDMAQRLFEKNLLHELPVAIVSALHAEDPVAGALNLTPDEMDRLEKTRLFARSGSPFLTGLLRESIKRAWFETLGVEEGGLSASELLDIDFVLGGELAMLQQASVPIDGETLAAFAARPLGRGIFAMVSGLETGSPGRSSLG